MKITRFTLPLAAFSACLVHPLSAAPEPPSAAPSPPAAELGEAPAIPFLGVLSDRVPAELAAALPAEAAAGTMIRAVVPGSPAAKAGIAINDIILRVGDTPVGSPEELIAAIRKCQVGQEIDIVFFHQGARTTAKVGLEPRPRADAPVPDAPKPQPEPPRPTPEAAAPGFLGVGVAPLSEDLAAHFGFDEEQGVTVRELAPDGPAAKSGLRVHDIILKANGRPVSSQEQLARLIAGQRAGERIHIEVIRQGQPVTMDATLAARPNQPAPGIEAPPWNRESPPAERVRPNPDAPAREAMRKAAEEYERQKEQARRSAAEKERQAARRLEAERQKDQARRNAEERAEREEKERQMKREIELRQDAIRQRTERARRMAEQMERLKALNEQVEEIRKEVEELEREGKKD